jgi:hypothetical protein
MTSKSAFFLLLALLAAATGCGGEVENAPAGGPQEPDEAPSPPSVRIVSPREGEVFEDASVTVWLESTVPIVPAGDMTPGTGHHHLYLDADLGDMSAPIPTVPGSIVHMGNAAREYVFEEVASGPHRLIAVVADGAHVALQPLVVDTVHFVVE